MAEMQGMLQVTPELEAQGRVGDTEVGTVDIDSVIIPADIINNPEVKELKNALTELYSAVSLDINQFTVTPEQTEYNKTDNFLQAHLTMGELIIPPSILQMSEELLPAIQNMFTELKVNPNQYTVGHSENSINPETGLPEFGFFSGIIRSIKKVVKPITNVVKDVFNGIKSFGKSIGNVVKKVATSPIGQIAISVAFPQYAPYINAATKVATGQKLGVADFVSLGVRGYNDITGGNFTIDPNVSKALNAVERVADGADVKDVLISSYGGDFVKKLGLDTKVKDALGSFTDNDTVNWLSENIDFNQAGADLMGGASAFTMLNNQFGEKVANYIGQDDPNLKALGYAGIRTAQALDDGANTTEAIYRGAREYYDKGGQLPNFGDIADSINLDINLPEIDLNFGDWAKSMDFELPDMFSNFSLPELKGMNLDWSKFDLSNYDFSQLKDIFNTQGISIPDAPDLGINLSDIDLGKLFDFTLRQGVDIETPQKSKLAQLAEQQQEEDTFENPLLGKNPLLQTEELPISRQLLSSLNLGTTV